MDVEQRYRRDGQQSPRREGVLRDGQTLPARETVPDGTVVGHVHLRVGGIPEAEAFYRGVVGLDITRKRDGATFYATSGYHHHLATNTWESAGSPKRTGELTGLAVLALVAKDRAAFDARAERMIAAGESEKVASSERKTRGATS